jgi:hypothetical protein
MTGASDIGFAGGSTSADTGDPEFVNMVPPQQWLPSYTFLTDWSYKHTHLVFVRPQGADQSFKAVTLDCLGAVGGWKPVGTGSNSSLRDWISTSSPAVVWTALTPPAATHPSASRCGVGTTT